MKLYDRDGTESLWRREDLAKGEAAGLSQTKHDLPAAYAEWTANHDARADTVRTAVAELMRLGYVLDETFDALNAAMAADIDAYRALASAIGATLPHESHIASLAEHIDKHGGIDAAALPFEKRHEVAAKALPAERRKYWKERAAKDDATAHKNQVAGIKAGLIEAPANWKAE